MTSLIPMKKFGPSSSVLMGRAKDEALHLLEWISYHRTIGFDDIVVFSNPSQDRTNLLLDRLAQVGIVHHRVCTLQPTETPDRAMINQMISYVKDLPYEWVGLMDIDEYLLLHRHSDVPSFLSSYEYADALAINWRNFGSNGLMTRGPDLTIERFTRATTPLSPANRWVKSFARVQKIIGAEPHLFFMDSGLDRYFHVSGNKFTTYADADAIDHSVASVNHYVVRSREEFSLKRLRGDAIHPPEKQAELNRYSDTFFRTRDFSECDDYEIVKYADKTKYQMKNFIEAADIGHLLQDIEEERLMVMRLDLKNKK